MLATSARRVEIQTAYPLNSRIERDTSARIAYFAEHPDEISQRLNELDEEWDVERALETGSASLSLFGLLMAITSKRRWLILPLAVQGFFLQHALQGWCPPLPLFRRLGFRTQMEIEEERHALENLRSRFI
jgi:hypothetical protein